MGAKLIAAAALFIGALSSTAHAEPWDGPYVGTLLGYSRGSATYVFNTDGWYNLAPGDTFTHGVSGVPLGMTLGYNWQNGELVYGFETAVYSAFGGISGYEVISPFFPADGEFDLKGHWFSTLGFRVGWTPGRALFYVQGGPAFGHLISEVRDEGANIYIRKGSSTLGIAAGGGVEIMLGNRVSFDFGYQFLRLMPVRIADESRDRITDAPAGPATATDHTIAFSSHTIMMGINILGGRGGAGNPNGVTEPIFDWNGGFIGAVTGPPLREFGALVGYNFAPGNGLLVGVELEAAATGAGSLGFELLMSGRAGFIAEGNVVVYGELGVSYAFGNFWDDLAGALYNYGVGVEVALGAQTSGFMEMKVVRGFASMADPYLNFVGGVNWHLGQR